MFSSSQVVLSLCFFFLLASTVHSFVISPAVVVNSLVRGSRASSLKLYDVPAPRAEAPIPQGQKIFDVNVPLGDGE